MAKPYPGLVFSNGVDWKDVNPDILYRLNSLATSTGKIITVTSGFRNKQQQALLYQQYVDSGFNISKIAAPPGKSAHESGNAVDAVVHGVPIALAYDSKQLAQFGLSTPVKGDNVHVQIESGTSNAQIESHVNSQAKQASDVQFFDAEPGGSSQIQPNFGVAAEGPGMPADQLANLWVQIANQPLSSPEANLLSQNANVIANANYKR